MKNDGGTLFGILYPNTPGKALLWVNALILLISLFYKAPAILAPVDWLIVSAIGIFFSLYLWNVERVDYPDTQIMAGEYHKERFNDKVLQIMFCYVFFLFLYFVIFIFKIR